MHPPPEEGIIENTALLTSTGLPSVSLTRTRHVADTALGTVHECEPSSGVLATTLSQLVPLLVEYSNLTVPLLPLDVQVIFWIEPTGQPSPPFGDVTAIVPGVVFVGVIRTPSGCSNTDICCKPDKHASAIGC